MGLLDRLRGSFISKNRTAKEWYDLAVQLAGEHKLKETHEALKKSLASTPQSPELCVMIALALEGLSDVETAIIAMRRATQMAPQSPQAQLQLGQLLLKHKRTEEALKPLREAVQLTDFAPEACLKFSAALEAENELEEALAHAHLAARGLPDNAEVLRNLGRLQQKYGHSSGAIRTWRRLLGLMPNDLGSMTSLGILLSEKGKHHDALALLSAVVRARPEVPEVYSDIAVALSRSDSHDAALQAIQQALSMRPKSPQILLNLALVQKEAGQSDAAINTYWEVVGLAPDWPTAHFNVGLALKERGDFMGAKNALQKAAALAPNNLEIQTALLELEGVAPAEAPLGNFADDLITQTPEEPDEPTKKKIVVPEQLRAASAQTSTPPPATISQETRRPATSNKSITGEIEIFPLTEVLEFLKVHRSTGVLLINSELGHGELRMREGNLVGGHAPNTKDVLGVLVAMGLVADAEAHDRTQLAPPDRVALELVEEGLITDETYREACVTQIQTALVELITWRKGDFTFGADRSGSLEGAVSLDTRGALMDALRRLDESRK